MMRRLGTDDYAVDAVTAAKALVGAWLCRRLEDGSVVRWRITETEAYCGEEDTACHAHKGRTARTDVMYAPGGCAYIYLCYGMHEMLNVVTGPEGRPEAVLIRGVEGAEGPGRLTKLLKIDRSLNREDLVHSNRLWLESDGARVKFTSAPRIGIAYASKRDQNRKWRFTLSCRADTPKRLLERWSAPNRKPCTAGKTFGVIGSNGLYRTCLHALPERSRFERLMNMRKAQR